MKRGVVAGGIGVFLLLVASWSSCVTAVSVYINDEPLVMDRPVLAEGGSILVPLDEFGLAIGIETIVEDDQLVLRWGGARRGLDADLYAMREGTAYATLEWMVGLVGGEVHRVGETWFVETTPATLEDLEASAGRIVLRFDRFAPIVIDSTADGTELRLTVHHSRPAIGPQFIVLGAEGIGSVRLPSAPPGHIDVWIEIPGGKVVSTRTYEAPGFYSFCVEATERPAEETIVQIGEGLVLHELTGSLSRGTATASWLYVESWRDRYRLTPAFPAAGLGTLASVEELAVASNAVAAINLGCSRTPLPVGLLIIGGAPYAVDGETHEGLGLDVFGWWAYFSGEASLYARHGGARIAIDDVNRPLLYGEVVAYSPGYGGTLSRGVPGSFTVVKARGGRVVSVYEGPFVAADPTATLVVASGEAKGRLSLVRLGDALSLVCAVGPDAGTFMHAFSAGPILVDSGVAAAVPESPEFDAASGWAVLATDWHGGLVLLTLTRERGSQAEAFADLQALLSSMSVPIRDAIVLGCCRENALVACDPTSIYRLGSRNPYALALCLVPLAP